jgi:hypothetical protein
MRIYFLYFISGGIFFFQSYYSLYGQSILNHRYGWSSYAIFSSGVLFLSGFFFLYYQKIGSFLAFISSIVILIHHSKVYLDIFSSSDTQRDGNLLYLVVPIFFQLVILFHSLSYLFISLNNISLNRFWEKFYPRIIDKNVASIVGSAMVIVTVGVISILILFTGVVKRVEREMIWKKESGSSPTSKKTIFIFKEYPNYTMEFYSSKLNEKLKIDSNRSVKMGIKFITDFGVLRGYTVTTIDEEESNLFGFHILNMECGNEYPDCTKKPIAPWEEK